MDDLHEELNEVPLQYEGEQAFRETMRISWCALFLLLPLSLLSFVFCVRLSLLLMLALLRYPQAQKQGLPGTSTSLVPSFHLLCVRVFRLLCDVCTGIFTITWPPTIPTSSPKSGRTTCDTSYSLRNNLISSASLAKMNGWMPFRTSWKRWPSPSLAHCITGSSALAG